MIKRGWSYTVIIRYTLLQIPGSLFIIGLLFYIRRWIDYSIWIICIVAAILVVIDIVLFSFTWSAYDWRQKDSMLGTTGIALEKIAPTGYVRIQGERWKAEILDRESPISEGQKVEVYGRNGLTLQVKEL